MENFLSGIRQSPSATAADTTVRTLNDPRLFEETPLDDALDTALQTYVSTETRPRREVPLANDYARRVQSHDVLSQYVTSGQWRALALASAASILGTSEAEEHALLGLWTYRVLALTRQRQGELAERELDRLEAASRYAGVAQGAVRMGRSATVAWPFELRVLRAQVPAATHNLAESMARLCALQRGCQRAVIKRGASAEKVMLNKQRLFRLSLMISGCALRLGDAALAARLLDGLADEAADARVLSAAARMYLQLGSIPAAERLFDAAEQRVRGDDGLVLMNRALCAVATGKWDAARELFAQAAAGRPERIAAGNNMAVCELYLGSPQAMLNGLQQLMVASPTAAGTAEELVFNYCTGLDLHYDGSKLREAKVKKMIEVGMWAGDGFDMGAFKIQ
ncbi:hypothetical protein GGI25_002670 [Coemansia spiralis]|uniref:Uncharacterized protein n=2 Tax=Coemansia TaxID=4863 RepID=A0A9W8GA36_9FUNG|nr:hypothetical protein BX070DRAFT_253225 [Coemansia spiralis]KAJ1992892.1 hypothetical protein EDC05_002524 [Coemansia umbellata]KAJ2622826.1 hypothetical protein GGI26_002933 [Coemansia sp. RSA 1358]KAJ2678027.1 hypothetical protein GGI25_002670 [Coemansia spiralis]